MHALIITEADQRPKVSGAKHPAGGDEEDTKDRTKQKACLERYRRACIEILGVLNKAAPQVSVPRLCTIAYGQIGAFMGMLLIYCQGYNVSSVGNE